MKKVNRHTLAQLWQSNGPRPPFGRGESGASLVTVMISIGILGVLIAGLVHSMNTVMKSQRHIGMREELTRIREVLASDLNCSKTITTTTVQKCQTQFDATGVLASTDNLVLRSFNGSELAADRIGSMPAIGRWAFRARCVRTSATNTLQIAVARFERDGKTLSQDPISRKAMDWRPLYGPGSPVHMAMCSDEIIDGGEKTETVTGRYITQVTMESTAQFGCGGGMLGLAMSGQSGAIFRQTVKCPSGKVALGGGAECNPSAGRSVGGLINLVGSVAVGNAKGLLVTNRPLRDGTGWYVECCLTSPGLLTAKFVAPQAYAICMDKS